MDNESQHSCSPNPAGASNPKTTLKRKCDAGLAVPRTDMPATPERLLQKGHLDWPEVADKKPHPGRLSEDFVSTREEPDDYPL
jgi:hypothetical protein